MIRFDTFCKNLIKSNIILKRRSYLKGVFLLLSFIICYFIRSSLFDFSFVFDFIYLFPLIAFFDIKNKLIIRYKILSVYIAFLISNYFINHWLLESIKLTDLVVFCILSSFIQIVPFVIFLFRKNIYLFIISFILVEYILLKLYVFLPIFFPGFSLIKFHQFVQWTEFTGVLGISLWIITVNCLLYSIYKSRAGIKILLLTIVIPVIFSYLLLNSVKNTNQLDAQINLIWTNYSGKEKYEVNPFKMKYFLQQKLNDVLLRNNKSKKNSLFVLPETALTNIYEIGKDESIKTNNIFKVKNYISGAFCFNRVNNELYNSIIISVDNKLDWRSKKVLVPFNEKNLFSVLGIKKTIGPFIFLRLINKLVVLF